MHWLKSRPRGPVTVLSTPEGDVWKTADGRLWYPWFNFAKEKPRYHTQCQEVRILKACGKISQCEASARLNALHLEDTKRELRESLARCTIQLRSLGLTGWAEATHAIAQDI